MVQWYNSAFLTSHSRWEVWILAISNTYSQSYLRWVNDKPIRGQILCCMEQRYVCSYVINMCSPVAQVDFYITKIQNPKTQNPRVKEWTTITNMYRDKILCCMDRSMLICDKNVLTCIPSGFIPNLLTWLPRIQSPAVKVWTLTFEWKLID